MPVGTPRWPGWLSRRPSLLSSRAPRSLSRLAGGRWLRATALQHGLYRIAHARLPLHANLGREVVARHSVSLAPRRPWHGALAALRALAPAIKFEYRKSSRRERGGAKAGSQARAGARASLPGFPGELEGGRAAPEKAGFGLMGLPNEWLGLIEAGEKETGIGAEGKAEAEIVLRSEVRTTLGPKRLAKGTWPAESSAGPRFAAREEKRVKADAASARAEPGRLPGPPRWPFKLLSLLAERALPERTYVGVSATMPTQDQALPIHVLRRARKAFGTFRTWAITPAQRREEFSLIESGKAPPAAEGPGAPDLIGAGREWQPEVGAATHVLPGATPDQDDLIAPSKLRRSQVLETGAAGEGSGALAAPIERIRRIWRAVRSLPEKSREPAERGASGVSTRGSRISAGESSVSTPEPEGGKIAAVGGHPAPKPSQAVRGQVKDGRGEQAGSQAAMAAPVSAGSPSPAIPEAPDSSVRQDWPVLGALPQFEGSETARAESRPERSKGVPAATGEEAVRSERPGALRVLRKLSRDQAAAAVSALRSLPALGSGQPLPVTLLRPMQILLGRDLSEVRLYTSPIASALGAEAFTTGRRVVLAPGHLDMYSPRGLGLIAHELAHTGQVLGFRRPGSGPEEEDREESTAREREGEIRTLIEQGWPEAPRMEVRRAAGALAALAESGGSGESGAVTSAATRPGGPPSGTAASSPANGGATDGIVAGRLTEVTAQAASGGAAATPAPDLEALAQQVYGLLKTRLQAERERHALYGL